MEIQSFRPVNSSVASSVSSKTAESPSVPFNHVFENAVGGAVPGDGEMPFVNPVQNLSATPTNMAQVAADLAAHVSGMHEMLRQKDKRVTAVDELSVSGDGAEDDSILLSQIFPGGPVPAEDIGAGGAVAEDPFQLGRSLDGPSGQLVGGDGRLQTTPFQFFLDRSLSFLKGVTLMERESDLLMEQYALGKASLEEVTIAKAKVSVAISFAVTMLNQVTTSFKEIQNMNI